MTQEIIYLVIHGINMKVYLFLISIACTLTACQPSSQSSYPSSPITYYVPWAAGGMTDLTSRMMATSLQQTLGEPVNVVNRVGGGGVVGHLALAKAKPDGYNIGAVTVEITMLPHMGLTDLTHQDYHFLALQINNAAAVTVQQEAKWQNVQELLDDIEANPGELKASGTARGGVWDLARLGMLQEAGLPIDALPWVPSQGSAPALQELLAGGVDVVTASLSEVDAMRKSGLVRVLGVMSEERLERFPEVPTLKEQGIDWSIGGWVALGVPASTPADIVAKLDSAVQVAAHTPAYIDALTQAGSTIQFKTGSELDRFVAEQDKVNKQLMQSAGIAK